MTTPGAKTGVIPGNIPGGAAPSNPGVVKFGVAVKLEFNKGVELGVAVKVELGRGVKHVPEMGVVIKLELELGVTINPVFTGVGIKPEPGIRGVV